MRTEFKQRPLDERSEERDSMMQRIAADRKANSAGRSLRQHIIYFLLNFLRTRQYIEVDAITCHPNNLRGFSEARLRQVK